MIELLRRARTAGLTLLVDGDGLLVKGPEPPEDLLAQLRGGRDGLLHALRDEARRAAIYAATSSDEDRAFLILDWTYADRHAGLASQVDVNAAREAFEKVRETW